MTSAVLHFTGSVSSFFRLVPECIVVWHLSLLTILNLFLPRSSMTFSKCIHWMSVHLYFTLSSSSASLKYSFGSWDDMFSYPLTSVTFAGFFSALNVGILQKLALCFLHVLHFLVCLIFSCNLSFNMYFHPEFQACMSLNSPSLWQTPWSPCCVLFLSDGTSV